MTTAPVDPDLPAPVVPSAERAEQLAVSARLTAAARAELAQRPDELSMRAVARRAGIDPRTICHHVESREDLVANVMFEISFDAHAALASSLADTEGGTCRERLLGVAHAFRSWAIANPADYWTLMGPRKRISPDRAAVARTLRWFYGPLIEICREGLDSGQIDVEAATSSDRSAHLVHPVFRDVAGDIDPRVVGRALSLVSGLHGYLILEGCGQLLSAVMTDTSQAYDAHVRTLLDAAGVA